MTAIQQLGAEEPRAARHRASVAARDEVHAGLLAVLARPECVRICRIPPWEVDTRYYDPSLIRVPTLLVHAEWDVDTPGYMSQALFARLTGAPLKRYVVVGEGTHTVLLERNRMQLFREAQLFLDEPR